MSSFMYKKASEKQSLRQIPIAHTWCVLLVVSGKALVFYPILSISFAPPELVNAEVGQEFEC